MAAPFLADTSVLARLASPPIREALRSMAFDGAYTTLSALELGYASRNASEWDRTNAALGLFEQVDVEPHHLRRAAAVQRTLAERGLRRRSVPDLIIAACAEDHGLTVLHYDRDFDHIASVTGQLVQWIVPAGSID